MISDCSRLISELLGHLFPDLIRESILPVNHKWVKCNASEWQGNVRREGAERKRIQCFWMFSFKILLFSTLF